MTAPTFDAHGWCHDMDAAPNESRCLVRVGGETGVGSRWGKSYRWDVDGYFSAVTPTAWRPLPLPPEGAE
jgi:hypothetical protein